jgi:predicted RNase H-like HicB family nuclease
MSDAPRVKIVVEQHADGFVAYPIGVEGIIVGEGDTYDEALSDAKSAITEFIEEFGIDALGLDSPVLEAGIVDFQIAS